MTSPQAIPEAGEGFISIVIHRTRHGAPRFGARHSMQLITSDNNPRIMADYHDFPEEMVTLKTTYGVSPPLLRLLTLLR